MEGVDEGVLWNPPDNVGIELFFPSLTTHSFLHSDFLHDPPSKIPKRTTSHSPKRSKNVQQKIIFHESPYSTLAWDDFTPPEGSSALCCGSALLTGTFSMAITQIDKSVHKSPDSDAWIIYKQNQFSLRCALTGSLENYTTTAPDFGALGIVTTTGAVEAIEGLYFDTYSLRHEKDELSGASRLPLHSVGKSRKKNETKPTELQLILDGKSKFEKLQFQASTPHGKEVFFRVVVCLLAKTSQGTHAVASKISPKLVVRAQNPARYLHTQNAASNGTQDTPPAANHSFVPQLPQQPAFPSVVTPPDAIAMEMLMDSPWYASGDAVYHYGRVGINTSTPTEALTVEGNIFVTGVLLKPSDIRLKQNFVPVDSAAQLRTIEELKLYDYEVNTSSTAEHYKKERGVIAQELKEVLPEAVRVIPTSHKELGNEMLIVDDRILLLENIGATQQLDHILKKEQATREYVNSKVKELEEEEKNNASLIAKNMRKMIDLVMSEDFRETTENELLYCGVSLMGLGPAWTMFVLGFLFPLAWIPGSLCILIFYYIHNILLLNRYVITLAHQEDCRHKRLKLKASVWKQLRGLADKKKPQPADCI